MAGSSRERLRHASQRRPPCARRGDGAEVDRRGRASRRQPSARRSRRLRRRATVAGRRSAAVTSQHCDRLRDDRGSRCSVPSPTSATSIGLARRRTSARNPRDRRGDCGDDAFARAVRNLLGVEQPIAQRRLANAPRCSASPCSRGDVSDTATEGCGRRRRSFGARRSACRASRASMREQAFGRGGWRDHVHGDRRRGAIPSAAPGRRVGRGAPGSTAGRDAR